MMAWWTNPRCLTQKRELTEPLQFSTYAGALLSQLEDASRAHAAPSSKSPATSGSGSTNEAPSYGLASPKQELTDSSPSLLVPVHKWPPPQPQSTPTGVSEWQAGI